ncbi:MAG: lamin tail domain-containing protein, partial [Chloroflexi bacterium]|nr:lamin tail domain-containing protein [Chloroflexota bacterium]
MYRKHATILILILALVALTVLATPVFAADADIIISEVMQDTRTGTSGEWVEIYNKGATPVIMNGWEICDTAACDTIPNITINSGEYFLIATSQVGLEAEFNDANYTLPLDTYNPALTTFVGTIGNTLGNNDMV